MKLGVVEIPFACEVYKIGLVVGNIIVKLHRKAAETGSYFYFVGF